MQRCREEGGLGMQRCTITDDRDRASLDTLFKKRHGREKYRNSRMQERGGEGEREIRRRAAVS